MSTNLTTIPVNRTLHDLTTVMYTCHVRRVPIVNSEDKVVGLVTLDDLVILLEQEMSDLIQALDDNASFVWYPLFFRESTRG